MTDTDSLPDERTPILLSAHAEDLIGTDAEAILRYLDSHPEVSPGDVAATVLSTRRLRRHRAVVRAADRAELAAGLQALTENAEHPLVTRAQGGAPTSGSRARIAFVFPGQGSQWPSMGVQAYDRLPAYRAEVDTWAAAFQAAGTASPLDYLLAEPDSGAVTNDFSQVQIQGAQFVHGVALARVWRACGVVPDITVGHSLGEIGAAYVAGTISLEAAVAVVIARATILDRLTGPYRVAVLGISPDEASKVVAETPGWLELSVVNSRSSVAVSGETDAVAAAVATVTGRGSFAKEIEMWFPAHTTALDSAYAELESLLPEAQFGESPVQFIGSATAEVVEAGTGFAEYWYTNLRSTVRFDRAIETAARRGARIFVELSAHPALLFAMGDLLDDAAELTGGPVVMVGSGRRDESITERLSSNIISVAMADSGYRWDDLPNHPAARLRDFPFAPMRAEHLWATPQPLPSVAGLTVGVEHWVEAASPRNVPTGGRRVAVLDLAAGQGGAAALSSALDEVPDATVVLPADADLLIVVSPVSDEADAVAAAEALSRRIDDGLLGYVEAIGPRTRDVWMVTVGGEQVGDGPTPRPEAAALAAMHRSLGYEHPDQTFRHLDLPATLIDHAAAAAAVTAMLTAADDIALRDNGSGHSVWVREMQDDTSDGRAWTADSGIFDEVVITGGAGAVGLHFARRLAEQGARRIVLLSRSGLDDGQVAALAAHGTEILAPRCDLTDPAQIAATIAESSIGPASLVIHAAASATLAPGSELTGAAARNTFAAKLSGLANLTAAWPLRPDARVVLCSSVSGLWGGYGHAAYSAANRLLDALGTQLRAGGRHCTAIRWGLWPGDGIIDSAEVSRVERSGLRAMAPDLAVEAGLRDYPADPLVFTADAERLRTFLGGPAEPAVAVSDSAEVPEGEAADATGAMRIALGAVLKLTDTSALDLDASLLDLGVDSLLAIDLRKKLKKATGRSVPLATILGGATAAELIEHLERPEKEAFSRD
ncbi:mycobactin polyketide synthase MbtD [Mycolicibacterium neworleansense]|uniref:Polyketide synthase n=1 Tax=Mycolicibacterium neworleansense TaxID=146018 RepID=A0A0H5RIL0_9MYCO|nr:mycobactin polyketide synthase MbtD [Mycolicibacterium neworleansense]MCV7361996.1 mycobactin polyketide synthase MbtD [Mycolicibacterium neworleansense]CRZ13596.1 polyketide synthase [Mycolicibacterium neworleansense]